MDFKNVEKYLEDFGNQVVDDAKSNLSKSKDSMGKARGSTTLGNSIRMKVVATAKGFSTKFYMLDMGNF